MNYHDKRTITLAYFSQQRRRVFMTLLDCFNELGITDVRIDSSTVTPGQNIQHPTIAHRL